MLSKCGGWVVALVQQDLDQGVLSPQQGNQVIDKGGNDIGFVQISEWINVDAGMMVPQTEPTLDRIDWDHPQNADHVFLHFGHVPMGEVQIDLSETKNDSPTRHDTGRIPCGQIDFAIGQGSVQYKRNHCQHGQ